MRRILLTISFFILAAFVLITCNRRNAAAVEPFFRNLQDTVDYVGIQECRKCHEDHYSTFIHTGMGSSFGPADLTRSKADFKNAKPVYDAKRDLYFFPFTRNGRMYIREYRLRNGDTVHSRTEEIKWIVGSGHHTNSHFWEDNGYLYQAPLTYYTQQGKWDLPPGFETTNTGFSRKIDVECMSCHNAMPAVQEGSINRFSRLPAGIDCERCHGPGELHVAEKKQGIIIDVKKEADRSIVNPARLPWKLQVDICQRCHLQGNNVLKPGKKFTDYRPGMHLDSVFEVYMPEHTGGKAFYMAGHAERLQMSACFIKSNAKAGSEQYNPKLNLTCITCHNPHVSVRATNTAKFNTACTNCHSQGGNAAGHNCSAPATDRKAVNDNCVGCHMPKSGTGDIPHVTVHDHYIRKPRKGSEEALGDIRGLYAVNQPKPAGGSLYQAYVSWFEKFDPNPLMMRKAAEYQGFASPSQKIHYHYANRQYAEAAALAEDMKAETADAWTCYRLAKSLDMTGQTGASLEWYRLATEKMPLNADFRAEYANALIRSNRAAEAKAELLKNLEQQKKHELTLVNLGAAELLTGQPGAAKKYLEQAVAINPDNETSRLYLAELYLKLGKKEEAKAQLSEALRINPDNAKARELMQ